MQKIHATVTSVEFDHDNELSRSSIDGLTKEVVGKTFVFDEDEFDCTSVADAVSDLTGWCVSDIDYTTETK